MAEDITVTHEGLVSTVTMNRPPMNLLDPDYLDAYVAAHQEADANTDTRVIVTRSGVPVFWRHTSIQGWPSASLTMFFAVRLHMSQ